MSRLRLAPALALTLAFAAPAAAQRSAPAASDTARLTILHTADLHGALTGRDDRTGRPATGGLARVATLVAGVRGEGLPVLLLDAGDAIHGSALTTIWHERGAHGPDPTIAAMNHIGYDAMAVGNHEFDGGPERLSRARAEASFPWLAANLAAPEGGGSSFDRSIVRMLGPVKAGVVGLTTPAIAALTDPASLAGSMVVPALEAARREVERLRDAGCDLVVLLAHTGLDSVQGRPRVGDLAEENLGGVLARDSGADLVILGHTHQLVPGRMLGRALVAQAGQRGGHLGRIDVTLGRGEDGRWRVAGRRGTAIAVADSVAADPAIEALVAPYHQAAEAALAETLGTARQPIAAPRGRLEDSALWELIQRAMLDATGADVSLAALPDPGVRLRGAITRRDVMALVPYENTLAVVEMSGAALRATLEHAARYLAPDPYAFAAGRPIVDPAAPGHLFDAAEGITYDIDLTRPAGERVLHLALRGEPLLPEQRLEVAVTSYRLNGGGGFDSIRHARRLWRAPLLLRRVVEDQIRRAGALDGRFSRNWTILPDHVTGPGRAPVDLLVRERALPREDAMRIGADEPARRGDLAYWLARAFGWRERRFSGAFADVPDSLEPWLDGLVRRDVLGSTQRGERFEPFAPVSLSLALDWCENAARAAGYSLAVPVGDRSFRRGLLTGIDFGGGVRAVGPHVYRDSLTRAQVLGLIANLRFPALRVLETTDFHGAILPGRDRRTDRPVGGSVALASWIEHLRAENPEGTVLLDGGDCYQGTMISNLAFGRPVVEQMNALGYAAMAIGNHEFDWTADTLERRVHEMRFGALGANMTEARTGRRPRWARADTLFTRRGVRVGVLGLCYPRTPSVTLAAHVAHLRFADDSATAAARVPLLRRTHSADVVIGVGHIPATLFGGRAGGDLARLARGVPGVDLWLGGHSHNRVLDEVNGVPVLIAGSHGEVVALCDMRVDPLANRVVERTTRLVPVWADTLPPDSAMAARVARWNEGVATIASQPVGRNAVRLTRNREGESQVGNLTADAMRAAVTAEIAFQNSGGLRADLPEGVITRGGIYEVIPFDNTIVTMQLTGAEVKRVLEEGLRTGRVSQVSGIRYRFDPSRPAMERVVALTDGSGATLDTSRTYLVATNNFMAGGGDDYATLAQGRESQDTQLLLRDALERYVRERTRGGAALEVRLDGRITRTGGGPGGR